MKLLITGIVFFVLPIITWFDTSHFVEKLGTTLFFWAIGIPMILVGADRITLGGIWSTKKKINSKSEKEHWSMVSEYDKDGKRIRQTLMVRCPNCNSEISGEFSDECKKCGIVYAAWRSIGYCEYIFKEIKSLTIDTRKHSAEEHDIRISLSATETEVQYGMDLYDTIKFERGIIKGGQGKYFEILDSHIGKYVYGAGFRPEYLLRCLLCHKTFLAYNDLTSFPNQYPNLDLRCSY